MQKNELSKSREEVVRKRGSWFSRTVFLMSFVICGVLGSAGYFWYRYSHTGEAMQRREIRKLVLVIERSVVLPADEFPTLATVTNKKKLDNQLFFQRAENGDKILIYSRNGRAILYRPSTKKVIDLAIVDIVKEMVTDEKR